MDNEKAKPPKGRVGGGRAVGQKNKVAPAVKRSAAELFRGMLGLDDEAVARTGKINGRGVGFRVLWKEILDGTRSPDPAYTAAVRLSLSYALGNPGKLQEASERRSSLTFVTTSGLYPWDERLDNMKPMTDRMLAQGKAEDELRALEAAKKPDVVIDAKADNDTDAESLEVVTPPPADDPSAFR